METILTMAKMLTNERREFEFIRETSETIFFYRPNTLGHTFCDI